MPSLRKLRLASGGHAYEAGVIDAIAHMLRDGELPYGSTCAIAGEPTDDTLELCVEAERMTRSKDNLFYLTLGVLLAPLLLLGLFQKPREAVGRETTVRTPLRVCPRCQSRVKRAGQRALRRLLRGVPIYARLLDEYPRAWIVVGESRAAEPAP